MWTLNLLIKRRPFIPCPEQICSSIVSFSTANNVSIFTVTHILKAYINFNFCSLLKAHHNPSANSISSTFNTNSENKHSFPTPAHHPNLRQHLMLLLYLSYTLLSCSCCFFLLNGHQSDAFNAFQVIVSSVQHLQRKRQSSSKAPCIQTPFLLGPLCDGSLCLLLCRHTCLFAILYYSYR